MAQKRFAERLVKDRPAAEDIAEDAIREIEQLRADIGIPLRLRDIGVTEDMLPGFAARGW